MDTTKALHRFEAGALRGEVRVAGDKSISHRALMFAAVAPGESTVEAPNRGADVIATRDALVALGAVVDDRGETIVVRGGSLHSPAGTLDARNSGTTTRLLLGLCAGQGITATFDGDASLRRRPMERVARPLRSIGAQVETTQGRLPVTVRGITAPAGGTFALELPSAQIKSAILLAHLSARGRVTVTGDRHSRDHTERMLRHFGRTVSFDGETIVLEPGTLGPRTVRVPGDLSAAAFFLAAAAITPGSDLVVRDVGVNATRTGFLDALVAMGADLERLSEREVDGEPVADLHVRYRPLRAIAIDEALVVRAIDEIPVLAVAAAHASGTTTIRGAQDLRAKESDRIASTASTLRACGIAVREFPDGMEIAGGGAHPPKEPLETHDDHRIAMAIAVLAAPTGTHAVDDAGCIAVSFPEFEERWSSVQR
jgi:3-phosphoshikimate 1-carboxyvinyltransferase